MVYDEEMDEIRAQLQRYKEKLPAHNEKMKVHMEKLRVLCTNSVVIAAYNEAISHAKAYTESGDPNPWRYTSIEDFIGYFNVWFTDLPKPTGGLGFIFPFSWMYNDNYSAYFFLNEFKSNALAKKYTKEIFNWVFEFIMIRGEFMDSPESAPKDVMDLWMDDPNMKDFLVPSGGFKSFNEFFTRELNPEADPRPISSPKDDSVVVASADTIINLILSDLTLETDINVKGRQIAMKNLLDNSDFADHFVGGTAVSCVLMPNVYHHYHSPVGGKVVESKEVMGIYNGIMDGEHWFNDMSNPGQGNTDFSAFEDFHRAYYVIASEGLKYGHIAVVPVGLNTISRISPSLVPNKNFMVPPGESAVSITKGDKLGSFAYGGSLNIIMFEKGVFPCVSLLQGNRLGQMYPKPEDDDDDDSGETKVNKISAFVSSLLHPSVGRPPIFGHKTRRASNHKHHG